MSTKQNNMPGFTAHYALDRSVEHYEALNVAGVPNDSVVPQLRPLHFFDCLNRFLGGCLGGSARDCRSLDACAVASLWSVASF